MDIDPLSLDNKINSSLAPLISIRKGHTYRIVVSDLITPLLRELEGQPEVAAPEALRKVRRDDRASLGWYRRVLQTREQGFAWLRRGAQQQDPRVPAARVWPAG